MHVGCAGLTDTARDPAAQTSTAQVQSTVPNAPSPDLSDDESLQPAAVDAPSVTTKDSQAQADLWHNLRRGMRLNHRVEEKRVAQELRWLQQNPQYWVRLGPRMQRYLPYILSQVNARDLPAELALLPVIESALDPYAFSPYGANGLWQFMRPTAQQYGLVMTAQYDGRRDVVASTGAALDFLEDLHRRFDDWLLALAAYNAGGGTVAKALRRNKSQDFFHQRLPRETQAYVPRLLAISAIVANPEAFGVTLPVVDDLDPLLVLTLPGAFDVSVLAQTLNMEAAQIYEFNPALKQARWNASDSLQLILPRKWTSKDWQANAAENLEADTFAPGEGSTLTALDDAEQEAMARLKSVSPEERMAWKTIVVRSGDTLSELAEEHSASARDLLRLNQLDTDLLQIGQTLQVPVSARGRNTAATNLPTYTVRQGDSLWLIAKRMDTSVATLVRLNKIGPRDVLRVGRTLLLPDTGVLPAATDLPPNKIRKINYRVRRGDSLSRIAQRFRLSVGDILEWNDLQPKRYLQPGQGLTLYVDVVGG